MLAHLADLADLADGTLILSMILRSIKGAFLIRGTAVNWGMAGSTNFKFGELVELDIYCIMGVSFALSLRLLGLYYN
jgi:hypothetical protein